jgi:small subunit ribosomal protein S16
MAITLRLARYGTKKRPFYRIVAADTRARRDGRFLELVGTYDPLQNPPAVSLSRERIKYWREVGAQPSETVRALLNRFMNAPDTAFRPTPPKRSVKQATAPTAAAPAQAETAAS